MRNSILVLILTLAFGKAYSQSDDYVRLGKSVDSVIYRVETWDGSTFIGHVEKQDSAFIEMVTLSGMRLTMQRKQVVSLQAVDPDDIHNGKYWFPNPNATRYLFGTSAFTLKPGEGYYQNTYLLLNSFNVGITNNISIGGGFEFISTFASGFHNPIFFLTPKVGFKVTDKFRAGGGVYYLSAPRLFNSGRSGSGILYGITTYGTPNSNVSLGAGWGFITKGEFSERPALTLSGMHRLSRKVALVSENWFIPDSDRYYTIASYGIRFFGEKLSVDLAFFNNSDIVKSLFIGIPYLDFVVKF